MSELDKLYDKLIRDFKHRIKLRQNIVLSIEGIPNTDEKYELAFTLAEKLNEIIKINNPTYQPKIRFDFIDSFSCFKEKVLKLNSGDIYIMRLYTFDALQKIFEISAIARADFFNFIFILDKKSPLIPKENLKFDYWLEILSKNNQYIECKLSSTQLFDLTEIGIVNIPISYSQNLLEKYIEKRDAFYKEVIVIRNESETLTGKSSIKLLKKKGSLSELKKSKPKKIKKNKIIGSIEYWIRRIKFDSKEKYDKDFILVLLNDMIGKEYTKTDEDYMSIGRIIELFEKEYKIVQLNSKRNRLYVSDDLLFDETTNLKLKRINLKLYERDIYPHLISRFRLQIIEIRLKTNKMTPKCYNIIEEIEEILHKEKWSHLDNTYFRLAEIIGELEKKKEKEKEVLKENERMY